MLRKAKIAILHEAFLYKGGAERLVTLMAKELGADIVSGFFSKGSLDPRELGFKGKMISLGRPVFMKSVRHMILKWRFFRAEQILRDYDIVIFSGNCSEALRGLAPHTKKVFYCHTPPRYLYDFRERYLSRMPFFVRPIFSFAFSFFASRYERDLAKFDTIFTNSKNTHDRLLHYCGYESEILYPPTDVERFVPLDEKNPKKREKSSLPELPRGYFFSFARLSPPKRVDIIVDAFLEMPDRYLVFTYGANDPEKENILTRIRGAKNIIAIPAPEKDSDLIRLIAGAVATIYIPIDEDFGMSPVESMACGTPVIGVDEGGLRETIVARKTGLLIEIKSHELGVLALKQAVEDIIPLAGSMRRACITRARHFSLEAFIDRLYTFLR